MENIGEFVRTALGLGLEGKDLEVGQMALRAVVVYAVAVLMLRLAKKRFMGQATAFDVILGIMLGSIVGRAITGNAPFGPTLVAAAILLAMHWAFSGLALRWNGFGWLIKGHPQLLVQGGRVDEQAMRGSHMTKEDMWEDLRREGISDLSEVAEARLERNGKLSVIKASKPPKVIEVRIAEGVQTVRLEISS